MDKISVMVKVGAMLIGCILNWGIVFVALLIGGFLIDIIVDIDFKSNNFE